MNRKKWRQKHAYKDSRRWLKNHPPYYMASSFTERRLKRVQDETPASKKTRTYTDAEVQRQEQIAIRKAQKTDTTSTLTGSNAGGGANAFLERRKADRIRSGQLSAQDNDFQSWLTDVSTFSSRMSDDFAKRKDKYQAPDVMTDYVGKTGTEIDSLLQRAEAARTHYTKNADAYDQTYGAGTVQKLLDAITQNVNYLNGQRTNLSTERGYWAQWPDQGAYDEYRRMVGYSELPKAADFAEKSVADQSKVERGERKMDVLGTFINALLDSQPELAKTEWEDSGWEDPFYAAVNGSTEARAFLKNQDNTYSGGSAAGYDPMASATMHFLDGATGGNPEMAEMTPEEVSIFNYLYATKSPEEAYKYYSYIKSDLYRRNRETEEAYWAKEAEAHPVGSSVFTVLSSPAKALTYAAQVGSYIGSGTIDQNDPINKFSYIPSAIRGQVGQMAEDKWGPVGSQAYGLGMSMADFLYQSFLMGGSYGGAAGEWGALALMGTGAAADTVIQKKDQGYSDKRAFILGTIAGAAEIATEKFGYDALFGAGKMDKGTFRYLISNMKAEGAEELTSDVLNWLADGIYDAFSHTADSEWKRSVRAYMADGKSKSEAVGLSIVDHIGEAALDALGGALSGGIMAGGGLAINTTINAVQTSKVGAKVRANGPQAIEELISSGLTKPADSDAYKQAQAAKAAMEGGSELTDKDVGKLYFAVHADEIAAQEAEGILGDAIISMAKKGKISNDMAERIMDSPKAMEVLSAATGADFSEVKGKSKMRAAIRAAINTLASSATDYVSPAGDVTSPDQGVAQETVNEGVSQRTTNPMSDTQQSQIAQALTEAARTLGKNGARALTSVARTVGQNYGAEVTSDVLYKDFVTAYNAGHDGKNVDSVTSTVLSASDLTAALFAGQNDATREATIQRFASVDGTDTGLVYDTFVEETVNPNKAETINKVAKALGVRVRFVEAHTILDTKGREANAQIKGTEVLIEQRNPKGILYLLGHEWTHRLQEIAPQQYEAFKAAALGLGDTRTDAQHYVERFGYTEADAQDEAVANYAGTLMTDGRMLEEFIQRNKGNRTLLEKVRDAIRHIAMKLKGLTGSKEARQAAKAEARLTEALDAGAKAVKNLQESPDGATMSKNSLKETITDDEEAAALEYKSSTSYKINAKLRDGMALTAEERRFVDSMDRLLYKLPVHRGEVYRRIGFDFGGQEALDEFFSIHQAGAIVPYEAFTSASTDINGYPVEGNLTVLLVIDGLNARDMAGFGNNFESEVIFPREARFLVDRVETDADGKPIIYMKEVMQSGNQGERGQAGHQQADGFGPDTDAGALPVQRVQEAGTKGSDVPPVPGVDTAQGPGGDGLPGVRGEVTTDLHEGQPQFSLKGGDRMDREAERVRREGAAHGKSQEEIEAEVRAAVENALTKMMEDYGIIKPGERPARSVQLPRQTSDNMHVSQTIRTIMEAGATPDVLIPTLEEMVADGDFSYQAYGDDAAKKDAEDYITHEGWDQAIGKWRDKVQKGEVSKALTAQGWALYNAAVNDGNTGTALDILDLIIRHQRSAAQATQATRILKTLTPEGQLYHAKRSVDALQRDLNERYGDGKVTLVIREDLAADLLQADTQAERDEVLKKIYRDIGRQLPSTFRDKWNAWRYISMLGNPRTHVRNIVGNAGFAPVVLAKDMTATAIESVVSRVSGGKLERTKGAITFSSADRSLLAAAWADYINVEEQALGSGKYNDGVNMNKYVEEGRIIFKSKAGIPVELLRRANSAALDIEDVWFSKPHYAYALAQYCKANGITAEMLKDGNPETLGKARAYAIKEAQKATYRDTNVFSQAVSQLGRGSNTKNPVKKGAQLLLEGVLPFRKTPANILVRGLEYSPAGLAYGIKEAVWDVRKGTKTGAEAIDHIASGLTGTGLLALGIFLAAQGLVRGHGGSDKDKKAMEDLMGHQDYALELGNTSITLDWLAPEALPFFIGVNLYEMTEGDWSDMKLDDILTAAGSVTEPLLEMSCLQSLNDLLDAVKGYGNDNSGLTSVLASAATSYLTQALPTVLGQIERTGQSERMTTYTDKNKFLTGDIQYTLGKASAKIPGWDYDQIPYIDAWGRTEDSGNVLERGFNNLLNPAYTSNIEETPTERELLRLYEATGEAGIFPKRASKYITVDKERKDLTAEEYMIYATVKGQTSLQMLKELTGTKEYRAMSDEEKVKAVKEVYDMAGKIAKGAIVNTGLDSWMEKAQEAERLYDIPISTFITMKAKTSGIESWKDEKGETIDNTKALQMMKVVYDSTSLTDKQYKALFEYLGVNKTVRGYNPGKVDQELKKLEKKAAK